MADLEMGEYQDDFANEMKALEPMKDNPVAPAHGIAALALNMALKYHDTNMVKDGALYQQYKLEGKNFRPYTIDEAFETTMKIEIWLLGASDRIASIVIDAVKDAVIEVEDDEENGPDGETETESSDSTDKPEEPRA